MNKIASMAAAAAVIALTASCGGGKTAQTAAVPVEELTPNVTVTTAAKENVPQDQTYSSTVLANVVNNIAPQAGGRIQKINVEVGDFVSAGQVLAEMDQVNLNQAELQLGNLETEFERIKGLYEEGGISKSDYESMELQVKVSKSSYENLLENTVLRAPVSGVITARNYDRGDLYGMASPIFVLQQITPVKILVGVSETDYTKVKRGDEAVITADALPGRTFTGKVSRIYPTIDPASHTFQTEVIVPNGDRALRPGMYAKVNLTFAVNYSVVVPDVAIVKLQGSGQKSVYVLNADNTVTLRTVTLGRHIDGKYEILSGIEEGETIVVKGQTALKNGAAVNVINN